MADIFGTAIARGSNRLLPMLQAIEEMAAQKRREQQQTGQQGFENQLRTQEMQGNEDWRAYQRKQDVTQEERTARDHQEALRQAASEPGVSPGEFESYKRSFLAWGGKPEEFPSAPTAKAGFGDMSDLDRLRLQMEIGGGVNAGNLGKEQGYEALERIGAVKPSLPPSLPEFGAPKPTSPMNDVALETLFGNKMPAPATPPPAVSKPWEDYFGTSAKAQQAERKQAMTDVKTFWDQYKAAKASNAPENALNSILVNLNEASRRAGYGSINEAVNDMDAMSAYQTGSLGAQNRRLDITQTHYENVDAASLKKIADLSEDKKFRRHMSNLRLELDKTKGTHISPNTALSMKPTLVAMLGSPKFPQELKPEVQRTLDIVNKALSGNEPPTSNGGKDLHWTRDQWKAFVTKAKAAGGNRAGVVQYMTEHLASEPWANQVINEAAGATWQ